MKILVLAGDLTNYYLYKSLKEMNCDVKLEGFNHYLNKIGGKGIVVKGYDIIFVPIPFTIDNSTIYSPYSEDIIHIDSFLSKANKDCKIIGGPFNFKDERLYDITRNDAFTNLTVIPTCEEIIKILIEKTDFTLNDSIFKIIGTGRIAKRLTQLLKTLGANVTDDINNKHPQIIINTSKSFSLSKINKSILTEDSIFLDVTSNDSTEDFKFAKSIDLNFIKARGLPGKSSPRSVSEYILKTLPEEILSTVS